MVNLGRTMAWALQEAQRLTAHPSRRTRRAAGLRRDRCGRVSRAPRAGMLWMSAGRSTHGAARLEVRTDMARPIWKGNISFGLVAIPVSLYSAEKSGGQLRFRQLDRSDLSLVKEKRVSDQSGREVPWDDVVKGYEYETGEFVVLEPEDFERANVKATQTIEIVQAVPREAIPVQYFQTPYYLVPGKAGRKAYQILRETLKRTDRVAVAMVVLRARQHLAAVMPEGDALMLDVLRFAHELQSGRRPRRERRVVQRRRGQRQGAGPGRAARRRAGRALAAGGVPRQVPRRPAGDDRREGPDGRGAAGRGRPRAGACRPGRRHDGAAAQERGGQGRRDRAAPSAGGPRRAPERRLAPAALLGGARAAYYAEAHARRVLREPERSMGRQFFTGFLTTLVFVAIVLAGLFAIFVVIDLIAGPVGG